MNNVCTEIDMTHWRLDSGYSLLAMKALEKWYRQSADATVEELVNTLKKMKRHKTADKIYRQLESGSAITHRSTAASRVALSARRVTVP
jgi:Death domain